MTAIHITPYACLRLGSWYSAAAKAAETEDLINEFELLKGTDKPQQIALRMGYNPPSLARRFARYGRLDLAKGLWTKQCGTQNSSPPLRPNE